VSRVHREPKARQVRPEPKVLLEHKEIQGLKEVEVMKEIQVLRDRQARQVPLEHKVSQALLGHKV
jgi:hypothetical protein